MGTGESGCKELIIGWGKGRGDGSFEFKANNNV